MALLQVSSAPSLPFLYMTLIFLLSNYHSLSCLPYIICPAFKGILYTPMTCNSRGSCTDCNSCFIFVEGHETILMPLWYRSLDSWFVTVLDRGLPPTLSHPPVDLTSIFHGWQWFVQPPIWGNHCIKILLLRWPILLTNDRHLQCLWSYVVR